MLQPLVKSKGSRVLERAAELRSKLIERQEHIDQAARVIKAIAHPLRLKILCVICGTSH